MSTRVEHPLPSASLPQAQQDSKFQRPRARSGFSLRSSHSRRSSVLPQKLLQETHEEKEARRLQSKADPSLAMTEDQPSDVASGLKTTLAPIRAIQHRDKDGNPIVEPDRSNPTRSRWERPLETIRSFEAAVDGSYARRSSVRVEVNGNSRSSHQHDPANEAKARYRLSSHYGASPPPTGYYNSSENAILGTAYHNNRPRYPRPEFNNGHTIYTVPDVQESHETVNSTSPSASSADPNYSTDPSSENSSIDRIAYMPRKETYENYPTRAGYDIAAHRHSLLTLQNQHTPRQFSHPAQNLPELSVKEVPRVPIKLEGAGEPTQEISKTNRAPSRSSSVKLKSWLGRRFSRAS